MESGNWTLTATGEADYYPMARKVANAYSMQLVNSINVFGKDKAVSLKIADGKFASDIDETLDSNVWAIQPKYETSTAGAIAYIRKGSRNPPARQPIKPTTLLFQIVLVLEQYHAECGTSLVLYRLMHLEVFLWRFPISIESG